MDNEEKWICHPLRIEEMEERPSKNTSLKPVVKKLNEIIRKLNWVSQEILGLNIAKEQE